MPGSQFHSTTLRQRVIRYILDKEVWETWPLRDMPFGLTFFRPINYRYAPCHLYASKEGTYSYPNNVLFNDILNNI